MAHATLGDPQLPAALRSLGYFALLAPDIFDNETIAAPGSRHTGWRSIIDVAVQDLLLLNQRPQGPQEASEDEEWQAMTLECEAKVGWVVEGAWPLALLCATSGAQLVPFDNATPAQVMAIKLLVRRLLGRAKHRLTLQEAGTLAEPVLRLLTTCLRDYGQLPSEAQGITPYVASLAITCAPSSPFYSLFSQNTGHLPPPFFPCHPQRGRSVAPSSRGGKGPAQAGGLASLPPPHHTEHFRGHCTDDAGLVCAGPRHVCAQAARAAKHGTAPGAICRLLRSLGHRPGERASRGGETLGEGNGNCWALHV